MSPAQRLLCKAEGEPIHDNDCKPSVISLYCGYSSRGYRHYRAALSGGLFIPRVSSEQRLFVLDPGDSLRVEGHNGTITIETWQGDEVVIEVNKEARALFKGLADWIERESIDWIHDDNGLQVVSRGVWWRLLGGLSVHFHVLVPEDWSGTVLMHTTNGPITARNLRADAELRTSNGAITVRGHSGRLILKSSNGRIEMSDVDGVVEAETSNGPIHVRNSVLHDWGRIRTSNGQIQLEAELVHDARYEVRTSNGRVNVTLINPDVSLDLSTSNGTINLNAEVTATQFARNRLVGKIGSGTARLDVHTSNGSISLSTW